MGYGPGARGSQAPIPRHAGGCNKGLNLGHAFFRQDPPKAAQARHRELVVIRGPLQEVYFCPTGRGLCQFPPPISQFRPVLRVRRINQRRLGRRCQCWVASHRQHGKATVPVAAQQGRIASDGKIGVGVAWDGFQFLQMWRQVIPGRP